MAPRGAAPRSVDHVIGVFPREELGAALAATHRAGFGPQTRVIDGARGDTGGQLVRAGLRVAEEDVPPAAGLLIVVSAPGRTALVAELFTQLGAESVVFAAKRAEEPRVPARSPLFPDIRIADPGRPPEV